MRKVQKVQKGIGLDRFLQFLHFLHPNTELDLPTIVGMAGRLICVSLEPTGLDKTFDNSLGFLGIKPLA